MSATFKVVLQQSPTTETAGCGTPLWPGGASSREGVDAQNRDLRMKEMSKGSGHTYVEIIFTLFRKER